MLGRISRSKDWSFYRTEYSPMESSSSSGSSKRAKAPSNITTHVVSCLVDGCNSDLSQGREYHRRHKICEQHSKTPMVTIGGREQRFCQQCSRFHSLVEFDEGKRSCRKRLAGHNRRRRKTQSEYQSRNTGSFPCNQEGPTLLSFTGPQLLPKGLMNSAWGGAVKAENGGGGGGGDVATPYSQQCLNYIDRHNSFPGSLSLSFVGGSQFKLLHENDQPHFSESSVSQPLLDPNSVTGTDTQFQKMFSDGFSSILGSDCALSLLSSAPAETREIGLSHVVVETPNLQQYCNNLSQQYSQGLDANLHCQGMFQNGPDGPSPTSGPHQTLSFRWE